jgi:hypothetical protein
VVGPGVQVIDSGAAVALQTRRVLTEHSSMWPRYCWVGRSRRAMPPTCSGRPRPPSSACLAPPLGVLAACRARSCAGCVDFPSCGLLKECICSGNAASAT